MRPFKILGVGSPLVDVICHVEENFLERVPGGKGGVVHLAMEELDRILAESGTEPELIPGGSAANTLFALASFGMETAMLGRMGSDHDGEFFRDEFEKCGGNAEYLIFSGKGPTGKCVSLVTPDGERTMRSCLGTSAHLSAEEVGRVDFSRFELVYFEGFNLGNPSFELAARHAEEAGCKLAIDLASFEMVELFRKKLCRLLPEYFDIVFANEEEAAAMSGKSDPEENLRAMNELCPLAAVKLGAGGSCIGENGRIIRVGGVPVERVVDTTGAGDWWAAGFFYGYFQNAGMEKCGALASLAGAAAVEVSGTKLPPDKMKKLMEKMKYELQN